MNSFYCFFQFINRILQLNSLKTKKAMNVKTLVFVICVEQIIYLLYNLHDCTFNTQEIFFQMSNRNCVSVSYDDIEISSLASRSKSCSDESWLNLVLLVLLFC